MAKGMRDLQAEMKKELSQVRTNLKEDIKIQLSKLTNEIKTQVNVGSTKIEEMTERVGAMEKKMAEKEKWDNGVRDAIIQLFNSQKSLQEKVMDLEGRSRRNNLRIYGIPENAEGTSMQRYVENMIMTKFGDSVDSGSEKSLGIERAHRALGAQPLAGAPPRSTVVRFLKSTSKSRFSMQHGRGQCTYKRSAFFFYHDYAENIQIKRRDYGPVKKVLKEKTIQFQTLLTKMHIHFDSGMVIYNSEAEAAVDLRRRGFKVGPVSARKSRDITVETINNLLPAKIVGARHARSTHGLQENAREKIKVFQGPDREEDLLNPSEEPSDHHI